MHNLFNSFTIKFLFEQVKWKYSNSKVKPSWESTIFLIFMITLVPVAEGAGKRRILMEGNYNGTLSVHLIQGQKERVQDVIRAEVKKERNGLNITLKDFKDQTTLLEPITAFNWSHYGVFKPVSFQFKLPVLSLDSIELKQVNRQTFQCFVSKKNYDVEFCMDDENFTIEVSGSDKSRISISGTRFDFQPALKSEEPREFTVSEAIDIAIKNNADLKIAWENMLQAKLMVKQAKLNLIPHTSYGPLLGMALGIAFSDPSVAMGIASDIVPFLFPTKIIDIRIQKWQYKAKQMAFALLRANTAVSVEELAINYVTQRDLRDELNKLKLECEVIAETVSELELLGKVEVGSSDQMQIYLDNLRDTKIDVEHQLHDITAAFSRLLGFNNPEIVKNIILDENITSIDAVPILNESEEAQQKEEYTQYAIQNSLEIRQQQYLERAEKDEKIKLFLTWFSPESDNLFGISFIKSYEIKKSEMRALKLLTERIRYSLKAHAYDQVKERNEWRIEYANVERSLILRKRLWFQFQQTLVSYLAGVNSYIQPNVYPLRLDVARAYIEDLETELVTYYKMRGIVSIAQAELDRLALRGPYRRLLPRLEKILNIDDPSLEFLYEEKILACYQNTQWMI